MRKTKIICTLGPSTDDIILEEMMKKGMNCARINFSHGDLESHRTAMKRVRLIRQKLDIPVATLVDTRGPEIRIGDIENGETILEKNQKLILTTEDILGSSEKVSITYKNLHKEIKKGDEILIDDGLIAMQVEDIKNSEIICEVKNGGKISNKKGINIPNTSLEIPFIGEKDKEDILMSIEENIDYIAVSFARRKEDIMQIKELLEQNNGKNIKIIAKIENREGVENIDEIIEVSDGVMVARGDMGVEIPFQEVPILQKKIIKKCINQGKIVITATQMLDSMIKNPRPTRAEAADVANAIYDGTGVLMLSGETAAGKYPLESLVTMVKIAEKTESDINYKKRFYEMNEDGTKDITKAISHATCSTAMELNAGAILSITASGRTAYMISKYRPDCDIIGCTSSASAWRQLSLAWGVKSLIIPEYKNTRDLFNTSVMAASKSGYVKEGEPVVLTAGIPIGTTGTTNLLKVQIVGEYL